jgi:hypothetical protein
VIVSRLKMVGRHGVISSGLGAGASEYGRIGVSGLTGPRGLSRRSRRPYGRGRRSGRVYPVHCVYFVHLRRHAHSPTRRHVSLVFRFRAGLTGFEFRDQRPRR